METVLVYVNIFASRDVTTRKRWAESAYPGWNRVKVSKNVGVTSVALVVPVDTSLASVEALVETALVKIALIGDPIYV